MMKRFMKKMKQAGAVLTAVLLAALMVFPLSAAADEENSGITRAEAILQGMTLEEKISQMIIPAVRTWNGTNVTDLNAVPELAQALQKHQYGGIILYGSNVADAAQVTRLFSDLQKNNAQIETAVNIPYLLPMDMEGGIVNRLSMGTRMIGNMAVGATGKAAENNAELSGRIIGEEMAAIGANADFAPVVDVNNNPSNPVIGTRSFSDEPDFAATLGLAFGKGLAENNIIATFKHFPGHGDTDTDSHLGTPSVEKTYEELKATELVPFQAAVDGGADMIMTAHITYPLIDQEETFADGTTGYYPATMSHRMMEEILRGDMGFDGVVVADALEMDAIMVGSLVEGDPYSAEYGANIAEKVINAGVDILLLPTDLNGTETKTALKDGTSITLNKIEWYDEYIDRLIQKAEEGTISRERIDESVLRILNLKDKYGILDADTSGEGIEEKAEAARKILGSPEHHAYEMDMALQAITLVKNEEYTLPLDMYDRKLVLVGRTETELKGMQNYVSYLQSLGTLPEDAYVLNLETGEAKGSPDSPTVICLSYYMNKYEEGTALKEMVSTADDVIAVSNSWGLTDISGTAGQYIGIKAMTADVQANGGRMIVLSDNLPYDSARYQDADAIVLAYMGSAMGTDPTERGDENAGAYNANVIAALAAIFGVVSPQGTLPVNVPVLSEDESGVLSVTDQILYPRGFGLSYEEVKPEPEPKPQPAPDDGGKTTPDQTDKNAKGGPGAKGADKSGTDAKTGDNENMALWVILFGGSAAVAAAGLAIMRRKNRSGRE